VALKRGLPLVVSIHGGVFDLPEKVRLSFHESAEKGWEWGRVFGWLFSAHRLFTDARTIITCNEKEASLMRQRYPGKQVYAQGHGVPMDIYQPDQRAAAFAAFPELANRQVLLCLGRVDPIKNQGWLVERAPEILRLYPGALLVFAGPCTDDGYGEELRRRVSALGLEDHVLWTGGLAPDTPALIGLLQIASVVLLPSVSETFGLVILEAWAAGAAVISSRTSGGQTHIRHEENGWLFDLDEPGSFFAALKGALSDPERRRAITRLGTEAVKRDHSLEAVAQRMREIYESTSQEHACAT
jgi:glycosyltransferase involved in cell wall biosynthesis